MLTVIVAIQRQVQAANKGNRPSMSESRSERERGEAPIDDDQLLVVGPKNGFGSAEDLVGVSDDGDVWTETNQIALGFVRFVSLTSDPNLRHRVGDRVSKVE
jgi:hypothetical protein